MRKIDSLTNQYPVTKTLRFKLIPVGETSEHFKAKKMLAVDKKRADDYKLVKGYIDRYHKRFIEDVLSRVDVLNKDTLHEYAELYSKSNKSDKDNDELIALESQLRTQIVRSFKSNPNFTKLGRKEMITELLPAFLKDEQELAVVKEFDLFTTYFYGFFENRENMYSSEEKSSAISFRCINENLPKFLDNIRTYKRISGVIDDSSITELHDSFDSSSGLLFSDYFCVDAFNFVLSESGIEYYNAIIGGFVDDNGTKIKGINEYINKYNQDTKDKKSKLPLLKPLYKQILSDKESLSFIAEQFVDDSQVVDAIAGFVDDRLVQVFEHLLRLIEMIPELNYSNIYVRNDGSITSLSTIIAKSWSDIRDGWNSKYDAMHDKQAKNEKYYDKRDKEYKRNKSISLAEIAQVLDVSVNAVTDKIITRITSLIDSFKSSYSIAYDTILSRKSEVCFKGSEEQVEAVKNLLDSVKNIEACYKLLLGTGKEENKDEVFYGEYTLYFQELSRINTLYDRVRNYVTRKPYSTDKIKLNFNNYQLLEGWAIGNESGRRSFIFIRDGKYYLAVSESSDIKYLYEKYEGSDCYEKMEYRQINNSTRMLPKCFLSTKGIASFEPSAEVLEIYNKKKNGSPLSRDEEIIYIQYFLNSIPTYRDWSYYGFNFKKAEEYDSYNEFVNDVDKQAYKINFTKISKEVIDKKISTGELYLFEIYNKDFSKYSTGNPNMHTLYFRMLFDEENIKNPVYKLNGGAEMFYREASIPRKITHPANRLIENKNYPLNAKKESVFEYDLLKDRRYTEDQFMLHLPISMNWNVTPEFKINLKVRQKILSCANNYLIGIDRGERNLLYISVIDEEGRIVEQHSLNSIINEYNGNRYEVNYHGLLDKKEKERLESRKSWKTIEGIKDLKEGYLSQVVRKVCDLVIKYDALIIMEDLNGGFKNSRAKVEKQVYQKFEKMLIDKLNYLIADKKANPNEIGGLFHAYQLTNKFESFRKMSSQNGIIFYVPAWLTSKIDPVTGFVNTFPKCKTEREIRDCIAMFDVIAFDKQKDMFSFTFDYHRFPRSDVNYRRKWTIYSNGERIWTHRSSEQNNQFICDSIKLTECFKELFDTNSVDYMSGNLIEAVTNLSGSEIKKFWHFFTLMLQMRNSITGNTDVDYLISPAEKDGVFYNSNDYCGSTLLPENADANGAYNIARKGLWIVRQIKDHQTEDLMKVKTAISNKEWLKMVQSNE